MGTQTIRPQINGKDLRVVMTAGWNEKYGQLLEGQMYVKMALEALAKHPVDMLIFEQIKEGKLQVRSGGYDLPTDSKLDESTVIMEIDSLPVDKFYFKIDNQGDFYSGTFLFPSEW